MPKTFLNDEDKEEIKGLEFSPRGTTLYITYYGQSHIHYFDGWLNQLCYGQNMNSQALNLIEMETYTCLV